MRLIRELEVRPVMGVERRSGLRREGMVFRDVMKVLGVLRGVKEVVFRLNSWDRDGGEGERCMKGFLERKMGWECLLEDERDCEWPMEVVWGCFAVVLRDCVGVQVRVLMDGVEVDLGEVVCSYVARSKALAELKKSVVECGRGLRINRRNCGECCYLM